MFCPKCGNKNIDEAQFCVECGAPLPSCPQTSAAVQPAWTLASAPQTAGIVTGVVLVLSFFLPLVSLSASGFSYSMSAPDMTANGIGMRGLVGNYVLLVPGIAALLVGFLVKKPTPRAIAQIAIGAITLIFFFFFYGSVRGDTYVVANVSVAFYLFIICAIALIACGVKTILDNKKEAPTFQ